MKSIVIGYGNSLRSDDGVGAYVAERVGAFADPQIETRVSHQLNVEMAMDLAEYDRAFLVDATEIGPAVHLRRTDASSSEPLTHHLTPETLVGLTRALCGRSPSLYVFTVRGENFDFGSALSDKVVRRADRLARRIRRMAQG